MRFGEYAPGRTVSTMANGGVEVQQMGISAMGILGFDARQRISAPTKGACRDRPPHPASSILSASISFIVFWGYTSSFCSGELKMDSCKQATRLRRIGRRSAGSCCPPPRSEPC
ncbi:hypothetical protein [Rhizobium yanglingense]